jgi:LmbE family N-acetylglucosaminyl deacetylase
MRNILVVAAHPDDEALGCGGTMARHRAEGDRVSVVFMTDGEGARGDRSAEVVRRREACEAACRRLGATSVTALDLPDNRMDALPLLDVVQKIEPVVAAVRPDVVYTHHAGDLNVDHRIVHEAVLTALRPQPGRPAPTILAFEVASSTEWRTPAAANAFVPNWYVDVSAHLDAKLEALGIYHEEMRDWPHARSIAALEHLARWRGACVGVAAAEAFVLVRHIDRSSSADTRSA